MLYVGICSSTKTGNEAVLNDRIDGCGKAGCDRDHFVAGLEPAIAKFRRSKRGNGKQVGGRTGVDQRRSADAEPASELLFELRGETPGCQPEIERRIHQRLHVSCIEHTARNGHGAFAGNKRPRGEGLRRDIRRRARGSVARRSFCELIVRLPLETPDTRRWFRQTLIQGEQRLPAELFACSVGTQILMTDLVRCLVANVGRKR